MKLNRAITGGMERFIREVRTYRVEPIAFLNFLTLGIYMLVTQVGLYEAICYRTIGDDPRFNCSNMRGGHGRHGHVNTSSKNQYTKINPWNDTDELNNAVSPNKIIHLNKTFPNFDKVAEFQAYGGEGGGEDYQQHQVDDVQQSPKREEEPAGMDEEGRRAAAELENKVQQAATTWHMVFQLAHTLPALFSDTILGALGDRHGRKANLLIGLAGMILSVYPLSIILTYKKAPLWILAISSVVSGFTGYMSIIMISCFAYLADTVVDPNTLTVRMTYFGVISGITGIFSPLIGNKLLKVLSYGQVILVCESLLVGAFFLALLIVRQRPPVEMRKMMLEKYIKEHGHPPPAANDRFKKFRPGIELEKIQQGENAAGDVQAGDQEKVPPKKKGCVSELASIYRSTLQLLKEVYQTYTRPRPGNARLYLLFVSFVYFLNVAFEGGVRSNVFSLYVQKSPFHWGAAEISTYRSVNSALHLSGSIAGAALLKKVLKLSDTTIILIAMGTNALECVIFAFAKSTAELYIAAAVGLLTFMVPPCIKSFTAKLVEPDEVGKSFTAFGIATNVAFMTSSILYSSVYSATVSWFAGTAFLLAAGLQVICMVLFLWLHMDYHYGGSMRRCFKDMCGGKNRKGKFSTAAIHPASPEYPTGEMELDSHHA